MPKYPKDLERLLKIMMREGDVTHAEALRAYRLVQASIRALFLEGSPEVHLPGFLRWRLRLEPSKKAWLGGPKALHVNLRFSEVYRRLISLKARRSVTSQAP